MTDTIVNTTRLHTNQITHPLGRIMAFIDGENIVFRYQEMRDKENLKPYERLDIKYEKDVFVWRPTTIKAGLNVVNRVMYYTYTTGDDQHISNITQKIKGLIFLQYNPHNPSSPAYKSTYPNNITPKVFKKKSRNQKVKGVDIQMTVDILTNVYQGNLDIVYLVSGDGDYIPVIKEVIRMGKHVYVAAFSSGLNQELVNIADRFINLETEYFNPILKLTQKSIHKLKSNNIPESVIKNIKQIMDKEFAREKYFLESIEIIIGKEEMKKYKEDILRSSEI